MAAMGEEARKVGFTLTAKLRGSGIKTEFDHVGKSFKAQFKYANKIDARFVAILGDEELGTGRGKAQGYGNRGRGLCSNSRPWE